VNLSVHRQSAAACVSLSKSTMSKTRTAPISGRTSPIRLAPDVGGGGYLANLRNRVKSFFQKTLRQTPPANPKASQQSRQLLKETTKSSQAIILKKLQNDYLPNSTSRR
jgi:hypothetical protein